MACKDSPFSTETETSETSGADRPLVDVRGDDNEIFVSKTKEGDVDVFTVIRSVYTAPGISLAFSPASVEKGLQITRDTINITLGVTKGRDDIGNISVPLVSENVTDPILPYDKSWPYPSAELLGNTEALSVSASVQDSKSNSASTVLVRPDRIVLGVINKDPRVATVSELKAAAATTTDGQPGILVTGIPDSMTFNCNSNYWFILHPTPWGGFNLRDPDTGFVLSPITTDKGAVVMNTNTAFSQQYTVSSISSKSAGTVTFEKA